MKRNEILKDSIMVLGLWSGWNGGSSSYIYITKNKECYRYSSENRSGEEHFGFYKMLDDEVFNEIVNFINSHIDGEYKPQMIHDVTFTVDMFKDQKQKRMYNYSDEYHELVSLIK